MSVVSHELLLYDISTIQMTLTHHHADVTTTNNTIMNRKWYTIPARVLEHLSGNVIFPQTVNHSTWGYPFTTTETVPSLKFIQNIPLNSTRCAN